MDYKRLQTWLGLPPGEWPPEPHVLLGIPADTTDGVQERALELMERLRPHQLRHPELVTEGMNRLAQALITFEKTSQPEAIAPELEALPAVLDAELVEVLPLVEVAPTLRKRRRKRKRTEARVPLPRLETTSSLLVIIERRNGYRRLAGLRGIAHAWERLGPTFGVPSFYLQSSAEIFRFLEGVRDCRKALQRLSVWPAQKGDLVRAVLNHQAILSLFGDLQKAQRDALAADWAYALAEVQAEEHLLRQSLRASKPRPTIRQRLRSTRRWFREHPHWLLALLLAATLLIAMMRSK